MPGYTSYAGLCLKGLFVNLEHEELGSFHTILFINFFD